MAGTINIQAAIDAVCDEFQYIYCYNCANQENDEQCGDCHRKYMNWTVSRNTVERILNNLPSTEPVLKKGKWLEDAGPVKCDKCGYRQDDETNFCPNCGAYMREEDVDMSYRQDAETLHCGADMRDGMRKNETG